MPSTPQHDPQVIEEIVRIWNDPNNKKTWPQVGEDFNISGEAARSIYQRNKNKPIILKEHEEMSNLIFSDAPKEEMHWSEFLDKAQNKQCLAKKMELSRKSSDVSIVTDKPFGIIYTGDWHLGDVSVNYEEWLKDLKTVIEHPLLKFIILGDEIENMKVFKQLQAVLSQVLNPTEQTYLMRSLISELTKKNKIVAKVRGNHDYDFDLRIFGDALQMYLLETIKAPVFDNKGLLNLKIGNEVYTHLLYHKGKGGSQNRPTGNAMRQFQFSYPAEVVAGAHDHQGGFEMFDWYTDFVSPMARQVYLIKIGTYQESEYGFSHFSNGGHRFFPVVIFFPDRHKKIFFHELSDAVEYLKPYLEKEKL